MNQNIILLGTILAIAAISAPMVINYTSDKTPQSESLLPICTSTRELYNDPPTCVNEHWPDYPNYIGEKEVPLLGKIHEKDIPIFFEIQLMESGIMWELADRSWANPDFEIEHPARICSQIIKDNGDELFISTIWEDEYTLSDMIIQEEMPDDCVKFFPVSENRK